MRQVEPWLGATGWGTTWPTFKDRDPDPDCHPPPHNTDIAGPAPPIQGDQINEGEESSGDENSGEDAEMSEMEDNDGEDPEQPEDNEDTSDDGHDGHQNASGHTPSRGDGEGEYDGDEDEEGLPQFASL